MRVQILHSSVPEDFVSVMRVLFSTGISVDQSDITHVEVSKTPFSLLASGDTSGTLDLYYVRFVANGVYALLCITQATNSNSNLYTMAQRVGIVFDPSFQITAVLMPEPPTTALPSSASNATKPNKDDDNDGHTTLPNWALAIMIAGVAVVLLTCLIVYCWPAIRARWQYHTLGYTSDMADEAAGRILP